LYPRKKELKALPPTEGAFVECCKRSYYQLAIWNASLIARPCLPSPLSYEWQFSGQDVVSVASSASSLPSGNSQLL